MTEDDRKISVCITCKTYVFVDGSCEQDFIRLHKDEHGHPVIQMPIGFLKSDWKKVQPTDPIEPSRYSDRFTPQQHRKPLREEDIDILMEEE